LAKFCVFNCLDLSLISNQFQRISIDFPVTIANQLGIEPIVDWCLLANFDSCPIISLKEDDVHPNFHYSIFSDGSKSSLGLGSGFVIYRGSEILLRGSHKLNFNFSNFQAELFAIFVGLERIGNFYLLRGQKIVIYSDSKSGLDLLKNFRSTNFLAFHIFHFARDLFINRGIKVYSC